MPFLSLLDDRAKPKGSRDPLGFELVWSYFGRKLVGNLTTITSSMDNFAVALLGFYWANQSASLVADDAKRQKQIREDFLRYEQLTGYLRYHANGGDIMGITRIRQRMDDSSFRITLGLSTEQLILSDQATYGLWGLYSSAMRESGLISGNDRVVTAKGMQIVEAIIKRLGDGGNEIKALLETRKPFGRDMFDHLAGRFMSAIHHRSVQQPLLEALMSGDERQGVQGELWSITRGLFNHSENKPKTFIEFIEQVLASNPSELLSSRLRDVLDIERLLVAINNLFHYCRRMDGELFDDVVKELYQKQYLFNYLPESLPVDQFPKREPLNHLLGALRNNDLSTVLAEIFLLNKEVMQQRSGAPWVELEAGKTVRAKVKSETAELKTQLDLEQGWDYDYFLKSFFSIASQQLGRA
jgi:hypothetical protein